MDSHTSSTNITSCHLHSGSSLKSRNNISSMIYSSLFIQFSRQEYWLNWTDESSKHMIWLPYASNFNCSVQFSSLSHVQLFAIPWTAAHQASLSITTSRSLLKLMSIELVTPSNHLILCYPLLLLPTVFPSIRVFSNESAFASADQSIEVSASTSVLPMNIQDWFPLGLAGWISLLVKGHSRVFSNTTVQKHQFFSAQLSL